MLWFLRKTYLALKLRQRICGTKFKHAVFFCKNKIPTTATLVQDMICLWLLSSLLQMSTNIQVLINYKRITNIGCTQIQKLLFNQRSLCPKNYHIYSCISQNFWLNFDNKALGVGLYGGHVTQPYLVRVSTAWTISRPLGLRVYVGACTEGGETTHRLLLLHTSKSLSLDTIPTLITCKAIVQPEPYTMCQLTLMHYQCTDIVYLFTAHFRYWLISKSLIFATFSTVGIGVG